MPGEKRKRAYGISCLACRQKKISCDGVRPRCGGCKDTEEECRVPTSARPLRRLQPGSAAEHGGQSPSDLTNAQLTEKILRMERRMKQMEEMLDLSPTSSPSPSAVPTFQVHHSGDHTDHADPSARDGAKYRLEVDEAGNVVYHGLTSWSRGPDMDHSTPNTASPTQHTSPNGDLTDPAFAPVFKALSSSKHISVAPKLGDDLLDTYFCYQVFNIIQRSTFLRDMALGGPLFSEFLLMAMYASATRMIDGLDIQERRTQGDLFDRLAKGYLAKELEGPSKITTIQGLLLLSGRECAIGNVSQGWNHAGLAFRMIHDLGIHLAPDKLIGSSGLSIEEQRTRDRLFWAAFVWDKSISLALGREPTFPPRLDRDPSSMSDFDDDEGPWTPFCVNPHSCPPSLANYVYQPKRRVAAFRFHARLCLILHDIIMELYSSETRLNPRQRKAFIAKNRQRLDRFWKDVPDAIKFNPSHLSPPPWIFMLQMLYHASCILLERLALTSADMANASGNVHTCLEHSITAIQMAVSFTRCFGSRMTYVGIYSSFVAASFDVVLLEAGPDRIKLEALSRLSTWMGIMDESVRRVPSIRRSVAHISKSVQAAISKDAVLSMSEEGQHIVSLHSLQLPGLSPLAIVEGNGTGVGSFDYFELFEPIHFDNDLGNSLG